ncbi:M23 family metallopeptidase [Curtobacterium sp. RRHDQ10]|uniref:M23 family metallopeptidase n=1 Tax=Curtobacterium phyllosphaerae TaxID=3413379 RepID=UPI003BF1996B
MTSSTTPLRRAVPSRRRAVALAVVVALAGGMLAATGSATTASATSYPSWADVQAAKASAAAQQAKVDEINALITSLQQKVSDTQAAAARAGQVYQTAQTKFDEASLREQKLVTQARAAEETAAASETQAGQLAAQLGRSSSSDVTSNLLTHPTGAGDLLYQLGAMSKLTEQADGIYEQASQARGTAQSLADQADVAKRALGALRDDAQTKLQAANDASSAAESALSDQSDNKTRLDAQLTALTTNASDVEANYQKGVEAARAAAAAAAAEAARQARAASATPNASGWVRPSGGGQTSPFGYRIDPYNHAYALHAGVDLAPSCGAPIYAAHAGTVLFAANGGGYGNEVILDNGGGVSTAYGHIVNGGFLVQQGQTVQAGQQIARVGSTGWSTGCHLHFETRVNGAAVDPVPFMAARGISV